MSAFQFPDPSQGITTVVNPITGSTYQWKEPPGKWVLTTKRENTTVWENDEPPVPNPGTFMFWYHTAELELYYWYSDENEKGAWVPTATAVVGDDDSLIWFGPNEPDSSRYSFWYDTDRLELLIPHLDDWWPVAAPIETTDTIVSAVTFTNTVAELQASIQDLQDQINQLKSV